MNWKTHAQKLGILTLGMVAISLTSCKKEGCIDSTALNYDSEAKKDDGTCEYQEYGSLMMEIDHVFGMPEVDFVLGTDYVHPMTGDTLNFNNLKYYVSNLQLQLEDGTWWAEEESYHLVCQDCSFGNIITLENVPTGTYKSMKYTLGVDSARNVAGAQDGALSVSNEMFWSWNSGYIMMKAEGTSPNSASGTFSFHLGGFSGSNNVVTEMSTDFGGETITFTADGEKHLKFKANVAKLWHNGSSVADTAMIHMPNATATHMATNFFSGVIFSEIHH